MPTPVRQHMRALLASEKVQSALKFLQADHPRRVAEMKEIALVQGETGKEYLARSPKYIQMIQRDGAQDCKQDSIGNVYGYVYGKAGKVTTPAILFEGHLDTVFLEDTPLAIREEGTRIYCPGIGDDAGGLAMNLSILRAISGIGLVPVSTLMIAGIAREEAQGNFGGIRQLISEHPGICASLSVDGVGNERILRFGVGVRRVEFIFKGAGGHSWLDYGGPACMHAMCRAMGAVASLRLPATPKTTVSIGVISGGISVGAIASEARVHVDMRSLDAANLLALEKEVVRQVQAAIDTENAEKNGSELVTLETRFYSDIPASNMPESSTIVQAAIAASEALGLDCDLACSASTNANIPMSKKIPAITIGYGGAGGGNHSLEEWYDPTDAYLATQKGLLTLLALAGLDGVTEPLAKP